MTNPTPQDGSVQEAKNHLLCQFNADESDVDDLITAAKSEGRREAESEAEFEQIAKNLKAISKESDAYLRGRREAVRECRAWVEENSEDCGRGGIVGYHDLLCQLDAMEAQP